MQTIAAGIILRVKNKLLNDGNPMTFKDAVERLVSRGFIESSNDGFFVTYEHPDLTENGKSTLMIFNSQSENYHLQNIFVEA